MVKDKNDDFMLQKEKEKEDTPSAVLSDGSSLIGQLCPGLRLCLAAEVATGLMCNR